ADDRPRRFPRSLTRLRPAFRRQAVPGATVTSVIRNSVLFIVPSDWPWENAARFHSERRQVMRNQPSKRATQTSQTSRRQRPLLEALESRQLLSASPFL